MADSLGQAFQTYSKICIFCVMQDIDFQKQPVGSVLKVLAKSLKTVFDEVHFIVNL